jgi:hypothetical protein
MAAVAASECGAATVLVGSDAHVGGMVSGGLSLTEAGDTRVLGGMPRRFYGAVADYYEAPLWTVKGPEPYVAERLLTEMLERAGVDVQLGKALVDARVKDGRIEALNGLEAAVFVDASYEGDLMAAAGVPYAVGREPSERYGNLGRPSAGKPPGPAQLRGAPVAVRRRRLAAPPRP